MKICEYLVHYLNAMGIKYVFGVSGANIEDVFDAIVSTDLQLEMVLAKHEFCAACMADGYSRSSNGLGVVMATSGGGSLNLVPGLGESLASHQPILAILGMPPRSLEGCGAFQDSSGLNHTLNGIKLFSVLASKYFHCCKSAKNFPKYLELAVKKALTPPFGTSILMIPKDVQLETIKSPHRNFCYETDPRRPNPSYPNLRRPNFRHPERSEGSPEAGSVSVSELPHYVRDDGEAVRDDILNDIRNKKVLLIIGESVPTMNANAEVFDLAEALNAWVAVTPEGKSAYKNSSPRFVGITGTAGHPSVLQIAEQVDSVIIIGSRLQLMSRAGLEKTLDCKNIIYINNLPISYAFPPNEKSRHLLVGNIKNLVQQFLDALAETPKSESPIKGKVAYEHPSYLENAPKNPFNFETIFSLFNQYIHDNELIYADAGNTGGAALHYLKEANYFGIALGMGGMGYAIGASIGSCFESGQITWCFLGDGALLMHGMEIHTAIEYQLPLRFIVFNNNAHAMCYDRDLLYEQGNSRFNLFKESHYGRGFAAMFPGFYSQDINSLAELKNQLIQLKNYKKPALLSLNVDYHELPPFLPFLQQKEAKKL